MQEYPVKPLGGREILPFVQQSWIMAEMSGKMLYFVQDLHKRNK